jgi:hypothetical protein
MQGGFPFASSITSEGSMTDIAAPLHGSAHLGASDKPKLDTPPNPLALILFFGFLGAGVLFVAYSLYVDVGESGMKTTTYLPYLLLFVALLIALGFEFVNGFHDTANAVATVIYTHSLLRRSRSSGPACSTSSASSSRAARLRSASSRCCRWS